MSGATAQTHVFRHNVVANEPLSLSNDEAYALKCACVAVQGLDDAALMRLAGNAHPDERAELRSAFSRLGQFLVRAGWTS